MPRLRIIFAAWTGIVLPVWAGHAAVLVSEGPTTIPRGDATGARDITVSNEFFAVAFAADTAPPWGVARGGIIDIAIINGGAMSYDIASLADFIPNQWSSWPTTYQRVGVEQANPDEAVIRTVRDWGDVELESTFRVRSGDRKIHLTTRMTNRGKTALQDLMSGYVVWPEGGTLFSVPGLYGMESGPEDQALADWSASYGESWALGLHAPYAQYVAYGGRDRYLGHDLAPGESRSFEAWLQIENGGTLAPFVQAEIEFGGLESGRVSGRVVSSADEAVAQPAVVVYRNGSPYTWAIGTAGSYEIRLPVGSYNMYATALGYAQGKTRSINVTAGSDITMDFADVQPPGRVRFEVVDEQSGQPLDARIGIESGLTPLIGYFGKRTFFTELDPIGETTEAIPPGSYTFKVSAGGGFTSLPRMVDAVVTAGESQDLRVGIGRIAAPRERGWYGADLHHHSDVLDGFTDPVFVLRSELAAGVDLAFLSDHDSVVNNAEMQVLSEARGLDFIAGTEMSPSWAHFNAFPLRADETATIDTGQATAQEIFAEARRMGADVVEVNHPYNAYGYFSSHEQGAIPGGYDAGFDLVEIVALSGDQNPKTLQRVWQMWNAGQRAYLAAGSDAHDVWLEESGAARTYVHVDGKLTIEKYVAALLAGRSFASQGPLVYPEILFGSDVVHAAGDTLDLEYTVHAVSGLRSVALVERGTQIETSDYAGENQPVRVRFSVVPPEGGTWYSLVVEDESGRFAYTNPVWVTVAP